MHSCCRAGQLLGSGPPCGSTTASTGERSKGSLAESHQHPGFWSAETRPWPGQQALGPGSGQWASPSYSVHCLATQASGRRVPAGQLCILTATSHRKKSLSLALSHHVPSLSSDPKSLKPDWWPNLNEDPSAEHRISLNGEQGVDRPHPTRLPALCKSRPTPHSHPWYLMTVRCVFSS